MTGTERLTGAQVQQAPGLEDWRVLVSTLETSLRTGSMARGLELAARIAAAADAADHHPDLTLTYPRLHVSLTTHDAGGLTERDVELARTISALAAEMGIDAEPAVVARMEVAIDALDVGLIRPFWEAVLGYRTNAEGECVDPFGRGPTVWFQAMDAPRPQRNRVHIDLHVPHDQAEALVEATLAAGGTLVSAAAAPSWWVLADPEGNEACVCTWQPRA